jgi:hypothetical protein
MIEALIDGERRGQVLADLAIQTVWCLASGCQGSAVSDLARRSASAWMPVKEERTAASHAAATRPAHSLTGDGRLTTQRRIRPYRTRQSADLGSGVFRHACVESVPFYSLTRPAGASGCGFDYWGWASEAIDLISDLLEVAGRGSCRSSTTAAARLCHA